MAQLDLARPRDERYTRVAIALHWAIAALIIFNLSVGYFMEGFPQPFRMITVTLHVSSGMTVLTLTVLRVVWRLLHEPPPYTGDMKSWERHLAHFVHLFLYAGMVLMPLTGWAILSAHPRPGSAGAVEAAKLFPMPAMPAAAKTSPPAGAPPGPPPGPRGGMRVWFAIPLPSITPIQAIGEEPGGVKAQYRLHEEFVSWHGIGGYLMIALLLLHIAGALKHEFVDKQAELARMGVGRARQRLE